LRAHDAENGAAGCASDYAKHGWARKESRLSFRSPDILSCYSQKEASPVPMVDCGGLLNRLESFDEDAGKPLVDVMGADDRCRPEAGPWLD